MTTLKIKSFKTWLTEGKAATSQPYQIDEARHNSVEADRAFRGGKLALRRMSQTQSPKRRKESEIKFFQSVLQMLFYSFEEGDSFIKTTHFNRSWGGKNSV